MTNTAYWTITGVSPAAIGPPAQLGISVEYCVVNLLTNKLQLLADGTYGGSIAPDVDTPVTNANIILAVEAAIQATETGYPLLVFIPILS
jgi:hypothetical protein